MIRTSHALAALALAFAFCGPAQADQLQILSCEDAARAAEALPEGALFLEWISHMDDSTPTIRRVRSVEVRPWGEPAQGWVELQVRSELIATTGRGAGHFDGPFHYVLEPERPEAAAAVDLAYVYVASNEIDGMFVNLGKRLRLPCEVDWIAIEVPGQVLHEIGRQEEERRQQEAAQAQQTRPIDQARPNDPAAQGQQTRPIDQAGPNDPAAQGQQAMPQRRPAARGLSDGIDQAPAPVRQAPVRQQRGPAGALGQRAGG